MMRIWVLGRCKNNRRRHQLWTTGFSPAGSWTLLKVDLTGKATPMLRETKMNLGWAIPSPDGSKIAIWKATGSSNAWLVENTGR
jgi:hypothetical protein